MHPHLSPPPVICVILLRLNKSLLGNSVLFKPLFQLFKVASELKEDNSLKTHRCPALYNYTIVVYKCKLAYDTAYDVMAVTLNLHCRIGSSTPSEPPDCCLIAVCSHDHFRMDSIITSYY